jgi:hypothetical protein
MSNEEYDVNLEAAVSGTEEVVLLDTVLEELKKEPSSRGYILVKTNPTYERFGFRSLGIGYVKVSDSSSLDTTLAPEDLQVLKNYLSTDTKLSPYIKYSSLEEKVISDPEIKSILESIQAKSFFLIDNDGGYTRNNENLGRMGGLQPLNYIPTISEDFLKKQGVIKEEELRPHDTHEGL